MRTLSSIGCRTSAPGLHRTLLSFENRLKYPSNLLCPKVSVSRPKSSTPRQNSSHAASSTPTMRASNGARLQSHRGGGAIMYWRGSSLWSRLSVLSGAVGNYRRATMAFCRATSGIWGEYKRVSQQKISDERSDALADLQAQLRTQRASRHGFGQARGQRARFGRGRLSGQRRALFVVSQKTREKADGN